MTRALGLSAFVLMLATPFVDYVYFQIIAGALVVMFCAWLMTLPARRHREPEIDQSRLQVELSEFVRDLNRDA